MRERLLAAFLSLTLLTVLLYGVPRAFVRAEVVEQDAQRDVTRSAALVAEVVAVRSEAGRGVPGELGRLVAPQDWVVLIRDGQRQVLSGPQGPVDGEVVRALAPVRSGGEVEVRRAQAVVRQDVLRALRPIVLAGLVALAVAAVAGVVLAGRLARPFSRLAEQAAGLGAGSFDVDLPRQPVREAEAIASALRTSSTRLSELLARERDFARNASHQLRTPLTGMRIRVEDVAGWPETAPAVREELAEVLGEIDRLSETVTSLLSFAREGGTGAWVSTELSEVVARGVERWQPLAAGQDREVAAPEVEPTRLLLPRIAVDQVLDVLVDNAIKHGRGTISVRAHADAHEVRFQVGDEGQAVGTTPGGLPTRRSTGSADGEGIGLALSADLVRALGGRLHLLPSPPTTFEVVLPAAGPP